jgi:hypothetical protein
MKKIVSLLLSTVMIITMLVANTTAYAAGYYSEAIDVEFETTYSGGLYGDTNSDGGFDANYYKITVPYKGKLLIYAENYTSGHDRFGYSIYDSNDNYITEIDNHSYHGGKGCYVTDSSQYLSAGVYYISAWARSWSFSGSSEGFGDYNVCFSYKADIVKPSTLKVSSRKTTSLGLTWSKVGDITGYQLQRKSGNTWKTITNTTSNSNTVSSLKSGTKYDFRVRSYINVDGTKYYSSWKTLSTPTKPSTPSIKAPSTNKKHQIIVKWNKVSAGTGYQVQYSKKKNFSSVIATKTVSGISKTSYTGKNFTKNKTYYVRVRAYKTVDGTKYYGSWSKVKSVKCK